jgi:hypothetical protein
MKYDFPILRELNTRRLLVNDVSRKIFGPKNEKITNHRYIEHYGDNDSILDMIRIIGQTQTTGNTETP